MHIRPPTAADHASIIAVVDDWWGGRQMARLLPRLFFAHFQNTSFIVEENGIIVAFLIGFVSQTEPHASYIHFVGVHPSYRKRGIAETLYQRFFDAVRARGCTVVECITSPVNVGSIAFHTRMGFAMQPGDAVINDLPVHRSYDGQDGDRVVFVKTLDEVYYPSQPVSLR